MWDNIVTSMFKYGIVHEAVMTVETIILLCSGSEGCGLDVGQQSIQYSSMASYMSQ